MAGSARPRQRLFLTLTAGHRPKLLSIRTSVLEDKQREGGGREGRRFTWTVRPRTLTKKYCRVRAKLRRASRNSPLVRFCRRLWFLSPHRPQRGRLREWCPSHGPDVRLLHFVRTGVRLDRQVSAPSATRRRPGKGSRRPSPGQVPSIVGGPLVSRLLRAVVGSQAFELSDATSEQIDLFAPL